MNDTSCWKGAVMNIDQILIDMTLEEKVKLLCGKDAWHINGVERLGVPEILITDGPHGLRLSEGLDHSKTVPATALPVEAGIAATWNPQLVKIAAKAVGRECQHYNVSVLLGPGVNGKRSPLGGRNFEYYSEDPYLTGKIASAFINGIQEEGVGACLKHFAGNEQETRRFMIDAVIDERTFHEIYLAPFKMAIDQSNPWTMMGAYNKVRGTHACESKELLEDILRDKYGYDGLIMSDWSAVVNKVETVKNGLDLEMPGPQERDQQLIDAVESGILKIEDVNKHARRVLELIKKATENNKTVEVDWKGHHEIAVRLAEESMVLLKNDGVLPLYTHEKVAVIGSFAKNPRFQGGGSSHMNPQQLDIPLNEIAKLGKVVYADGYEAEYTSEGLIREAVEAVKDADKVVIFTGTTEMLESEGFDRADMKIPSDHLKLIKSIAEVHNRIVVVLNCGSAVETYDFEGVSRALLQSWLPGQGGGLAVANLLYGKSNPSGRLSETFPVRIEHNPSYGAFPGTKKEVVYSEGILTGYRYYDTKKMPVQYPFGYGLSYSSFSYSNLIVDVGRLAVYVNVRNTSGIAGREVVQVYIKDVDSYEFRPEKELKGFNKIYLEPDEEKTVMIQLDEDAFAYYLTHLGKFAVESGDFIIKVGSSSRNIHVEKRIHIDSNVDVREMPTLEDTVKDWLEDPRTKDRMNQMMEQMDIDEYSPHYGIMVGMPMTKVLWFYQMQGASDEDIQKVEGMLCY